MKKPTALNVRKTFFESLKSTLFLHWELKLTTLLITLVLVYFAHLS
jgi:hypothetical protein